MRRTDNAIKNHWYSTSRRRRQRQAAKQRDQVSHRAVRVVKPLQIKQAEELAKKQAAAASAPTSVSQLFPPQRRLMPSDPDSWTPPAFTLTNNPTAWTPPDAKHTLCYDQNPHDAQRPHEPRLVLE